MSKPLIKINTCPFCGGSNVIVKCADDYISESYGEMWIKCIDCGARGPKYTNTESRFIMTPAQAVKAWNVHHESKEIPCVTDDAVYDD